MARKGQFKKGGGRVGAGTHHKRKSSKRHSTAMTHTRTRTVYRAAPKKHHARGKHGGGGIKLSHLAIAAAGLGYVTSANHGVAFIKDNAAKIPGAATFGTPAAIGIAALAVDKFVKPNKWLKLLGYAGIVLAATKLGDAGTEFKFVGDADYDLGGDVDD